MSKLTQKKHPLGTKYNSVSSVGQRKDANSKRSLHWNGGLIDGALLAVVGVTGLFLLILARKAPTEVRLMLGIGTFVSIGTGLFHLVSALSGVKGSKVGRTLSGHSEHIGLLLGAVLIVMGFFLIYFIIAAWVSSGGAKDWSPVYMPIFFPIYY